MSDFLYLGKTALNNLRINWLKNILKLARLERFINHTPLQDDDTYTYHTETEIAGINTHQNKATTTVHQSVSESVTKLLGLYGWILNDITFNRVLRTINTWAKDLAADDPIHSAATLCVERITATDYHYMDERSQVNVRQLLALCWLAIHHQALRQGSLIHAQRQFCEGLYSIQRGHRHAARRIDEGGPDHPLCKAETFNRLVESLEGIHPAVRVIHMNSKIAGFKLSVVVREEALRYLEEHTNPTTAIEFLNITATLKQLEKNGISAIWQAIKPKVADRIFKEFSSLFTDAQDPRFIDLVDTGLQVELGKLPSLQKPLSESAGYKEHCRAALKLHGLFSHTNRTQSKDHVDAVVPTTMPGI